MDASFLNEVMSVWTRLPLCNHKPSFSSDDFNTQGRSEEIILFFLLFHFFSSSSFFFSFFFFFFFIISSFSQIQRDAWELPARPQEEGAGDQMPRLWGEVSTHSLYQTTAHEREAFGECSVINST